MADEKKVCDQIGVLSELKTTSAIHTKSLDKQTDMLEALVKQGATNTEQLKIHIERTNILQSRQFKILILIAIGLGAAAVKVGPSAFKFLGFIL